MAIIYPTFENIGRLKVKPTQGEMYLLEYLYNNLSDEYEIFFQPYLDGDRPDIIILKKACGAFVIEVKDWDLNNYQINKNNEWRVKTEKGKSKIKSPQEQVFKYKQNLYLLHLSVLGLNYAKDRNFYDLVDCFVYFHETEQGEKDKIYNVASGKNKGWENELNNSGLSRKNYKEYEKVKNRQARKNRNIQRDEGMSFDINSLYKMVNKITTKKNSNDFVNEIYEDFHRRLSPPTQVERQGIEIKLSPKQSGFSESKIGNSKIQGVAGCGKTQILASRAINSLNRHGGNVLILTFNITLKNCIKDRISDILGTRKFVNIEFSNYHQFYMSQCNNLNIDFMSGVEKYGIDEVFSKDPFKAKDCKEYQYETILLDEVQDYEDQWVKIIRDNFLCNDGEMVLFGDQEQNIYERDGETESEGEKQAVGSRVIARGFGSWNRPPLSGSYRVSNSNILSLFNDFRYKLLKKSDTQINFDLFADKDKNLLEYKKVNPADWEQEIFNFIRDYIRDYKMHPNDIVILSSDTARLSKLNDMWNGKEKTHCMFPTSEELASRTTEEEIDEIEKIKKNHFHANSGLIKFSTIHSFKGWESENVFYIIEEKDNPEIVYTSITRSKRNLVVFDISNKNIASSFFQENENIDKQ